MNYSANILIADDEKGMLNTLSGILEDEGYRIVGCQNCREAIDYLTSDSAEAPIDIVISDLKLSDLSGLDILALLKKINSDAAFILITANASLETAIEALNQGAFAYHLKPLDIDALNNSISTALKQQKLMAENRDLLEKVQQSEVKYRTLVEQAADGIFLVEPFSGRFVDINPRMEELSGRSKEELLNMTLPMLQAEPERASTIEMLNRTLEQGQATVDEMPLQKGNGELVYVDLNSSLLEYLGGQVILGIARDATERRATQEHFRETSKLASAGQLAAGVAHEINNPLTVVIGFSEILLGQGLSESAEARVQSINSEAKRAAKIVQNLLAFASKHEPDKQYSDVVTVLERTLELKARDFMLNNIEVRTQWGPNLPRTMVDEHQLIEVILNILINAEHALADVDRDGVITIETGKLADRIRISITDNGAGIPEEHTRKIFDPFFTTKEIGQGSGLGLSVSYGIIKQHAGDIWVESVVGKGSTFHIELPITSPVGATVEPEEPVQIEERVPEKPLNVLVVDDEPNIRTLVAASLSLGPCVVDMAQDGYEGWDKVQNAFYDTIILDIKMPGMSGQELYQMIEKYDKEQAQKVIFVTGDIASPDTYDFIAATGNPSLSKPFNVAEFRKLVLDSAMAVSSASK